MSLIYIASPLRAKEAWGVQRNLAFARLAMAHAIATNPGCTPVAPHLLFPQVLDCLDPEQDVIGIGLANRLLAACDQMHVYLPSEGHVSTGMAAELRLWWDTPVKTRGDVKGFVLHPQIPAEYQKQAGIYPTLDFDGAAKRADPPARSGMRATLNGVLGCPIETAFVRAFVRLEALPPNYSDEAFRLEANLKDVERAVRQ